MSIYTTFKTYNDVLDYLQVAEYPKCFAVNYKPDTDEYSLWIGNQPYLVYEEWLLEKEHQVRVLRQKKKKLQNEKEEYRLEICRLYDKYCS